ncbi:MAG: formylglycine-generating enzyme family protein [Candidatus Parabeggiatoa sp. nov. 1]|nr:MAG: formylglycine-generating enzyme family protein [Gammaproteobacteria bacterium]
MVWIPAGQFRMGDIRGAGKNNEKPVHEVSVKRFAIGRYPVTFAEYDKFAKAMGKEKPNDKSWGRDNRPVINVSWDDAVAYVKWLSEQTGQQYRLPTEAEWEYAARAGTETDYWWGNKIGNNRANCDGSGSQWSGKQTSPVGSFAPNPFGLYDTVGNVWEWCADPWHDNYENAPTDGSIWEKTGENRRLLRGGSFLSGPNGCRAANRYRNSSVNRSLNGGVRCRGCVDLALYPIALLPFALFFSTLFSPPAGRARNPNNPSIRCTTTLFSPPAGYSRHITFKYMIFLYFYMISGWVGGGVLNFHSFLV